MENNQKKGRQRIYIAAIVALLLLNGFTLYLLFSENKQRVNVISEKTILMNDFQRLNDTMAARNEEIEQYAGRSVELDKSIAEKQGRIEEQEKQIAQLLSKNKLTAGELAKARKLIAQYETSITDMTAQIAELTQKNEQLTAHNQQLSVDLTSEKQNTARLTETNAGLSKKVEIGSLLPIAKLDVEAIKRRSNGKEVEVKKAKSAESLKISFETGENKVIDPGKLDLFVRIINPKGETIAVADQGSGTLSSTESEEPMPYTKKAEIDYNQSNKKVVVYWSQNIQTPGVYKVQVLQSGRVIGQSEVKLT